MLQPSLGRVAVDLLLEAPQEHLPDQSDAALRDELRPLVEDFLDSLAVPVGIDLTIHRIPTHSSGRADASYAATVDGCRCRVELRPGGPAAFSSGRLARTIARDLCCNRRLFVSPTLCERLHAEWAAEPGSRLESLPPNTFRLLLLHLVERGIRLDRIKKLTVTPGEAQDVQLCQDSLEETIAASGATRMRVLLSPDAHRQLREGTPTGDQRSFSRLLERASDRLFSERGVLIDPPAADVDSRLRGAGFRLQLNDLRWPPIEGLAAGEWLVVARSQKLQELGITGAGAIHPSTGVPCVRVSGDDDLLERCRGVGVTLGAAGFIVASLRLMAARHAGHLLTTATVRRQLELLRQTDPVLVDATLGRFDPEDLTWILRDIVDGGVSVRNLRNVLEILLSLEGTRASPRTRARSGAPRDVAYWADWGRAGLQRQISWEHSTAGNTLTVHLLAPELETRIAASGDRPLEDPELLRLLDVLMRAQATQPERPLVILTAQDVARRLRPLICCELPRVAVIAYPELSPDVNIQPHGPIREA